MLPSISKASTYAGLILLVLNVSPFDSFLAELIVFIVLALIMSFNLPTEIVLRTDGNSLNVNIVNKGTYLLSLVEYCIILISKAYMVLFISSFFTEIDLSNFVYPVALSFSAIPLMLFQHIFYFKRLCPKHWIGKTMRLLDSLFVLMVVLSVYARGLIPLGFGSLALGMLGFNLFVYNLFFNEKNLFSTL